MKTWESSTHALSVDEAFVMMDALRLKSDWGMFSDETMWERHPNRFERAAVDLDAQIDDQADTVEVTLSPAQRYLCRRAIQWTQRHPSAVVSQAEFAEDIEVEKTIKLDAETGRPNEYRKYSLLIGSRPYNLIFLAPQVLHNLGATTAKPAFENPFVSFMAFEKRLHEERLEQAA